MPDAQCIALIPMGLGYPGKAVWFNAHPWFDAGLLPELKQRVPAARARP